MAVEWAADPYSSIILRVVPQTSGSGTARSFLIPKLERKFSKFGSGALDVADLHLRFQNPAREFLKVY
jgi:hypothetical protein